MHRSAKTDGGAHQFGRRSPFLMSSAAPGGVPMPLHLVLAAAAAGHSPLPAATGAVTAAIRPRAVWWLDFLEGAINNLQL